METKDKYTDDPNLVENVKLRKCLVRILQQCKLLRDLPGTVLADRIEPLAEDGLGPIGKESDEPT